MLKTSAYGLGFQHLPRDLANVNAWKTMFDPYSQVLYHVAIKAGLYRKAVQVYYIPKLYPVTFSLSILNLSSEVQESLEMRLKEF